MSLYQLDKFSHQTIYYKIKKDPTVWGPPAVQTLIS
jgi:hypothetical protein